MAHEKYHEIGVRESITDIALIVGMTMQRLNHSMIGDSREVVQFICDKAEKFESERNSDDDDYDYLSIIEPYADDVYIDLVADRLVGKSK